MARTDTKRPGITKSSGNVFADIGFDDKRAEEYAVKSDLISLLHRSIRLRGLSQVEAAKLCGTDQPTLSKVLNGKFDSLTIDRLARWIVALGGTIHIDAAPPGDSESEKRGALSIEVS